MNTAWQLEILDDAIALLTIDLPGKPVNTLGRDVMLELSNHVADLTARDDVRGLLVRSGKPGQYIAGANLHELGLLVDASDELIEEGLSSGHDVFNAIGDLPFPTVALVDGKCLGGGTELVLSMDERIAVDEAGVDLVLPEVKIGLFPAWGGSQRLARLVGLHHAIEIICGGAPVPARRAAELGLVFDAVDAESLVEEGKRLIRWLAEDDRFLDIREKRRAPMGLSDDQANFSFAVASGQVMLKTKGHYPAPLAAIEAMQQGLNRPLAEGLEIERECARQIVGSEISGNMIRLFFMQTRLGQDAGGPVNTAPRCVQRVGVLGAGLMGAGITTAAARRGLPATMVDVDNERLAAGLENAAAVVESRIKIGRATPEDVGRMMALISTSTSHAALADCDVVIEAVTENEELKTSIYGQLADTLGPDTILASNTSTISVTRMASAVPDAERFAGMHFFNPVDRMQLVEVIRGARSSDETLATLVALARRLGKTPIVVKDCPGFLVNRILLPYMAESLQLLREGASADAIDRAATRFGMPMGPIALHDLVGLDTALFAGRVVSAAFADRAIEMPILEDLVAAGRLGKKSGSGIRQFVGRRGKPAQDPEFEHFLEPHRLESRDFSTQDLQDRLFLPMLLEATRVMEEEIVREPAHADMGLILGIGFPPFRGGLLRWCDSLGAGEILKRLEPMIDLGPRFAPTDSLATMASNNSTWHAAPAGAPR
ncbi:MAG TPA: 3-hydroxyacyl-CoA dehydrogenase [Planctomycetaceae bacterium]|nr:3-hydroxyacyl-CoA dehydrogenase [Planctomycetaceae bacterium]|tara:strand:+ start:616 stop:2769 length:2154 start_codon:yes stop_codon:yes gene_type:complete